MAGRGQGAGAADFARFKQYDYKANSNLVLTAEQRTSVGREPDGSAETLWGRMAGRMGDRAQATKPEGLTKPKKRRPGDTGDASDMPKRRRAGGAASSVLDIDTAGQYRPRTAETRQAYEALLSVVRSAFGDQPADVLRGAADEVLAALKSQALKDPERQRELGSLLGPVADERYAQLVALGKMLTDWAPPGEAAAAAAALAEGGEGLLDEDIGVAVEFEDEDEDESEEELADEVDDGDEEEEEGEGGEPGADGGRAGSGGVRAGRDTDAGEEARDDGVPVQDIDAYWLQRRIAKAGGETLDPAAAQALAEDVLTALGSASDGRDAENRLVPLLGFDRFDLIKELLANRLRVVWCTRLARAQDDEERGRIEAEMEGSPDTEAILDALRSTRATARERQSAVERNIRREARALAAAADGGAAEAAGAAGVAGERGGAAAARKTIDLESLTFASGAHFNSSRQCTLPQGSYRTVHKGYEEVHVPALKPKPFADGESLKEITELPEWAQPGFKGMKTLNRVQSKVCDTALFTGENMLVCAPTGAGKTNVAMLSMLHEIGLYRRPDGSIDTAAFKMIYIAPMKALVAEMVGSFSKPWSRTASRSASSQATSP